MTMITKDGDKVCLPVTALASRGLLLSAESRQPSCGPSGIALRLSQNMWYPHLDVTYCYRSFQVRIGPFPCLNHYATAGRTVNNFI